MTAKLLDEEALFHSARRIADPGARALFIDQACGDNAELAERVRRLLEVHEQEGESADAASVQTAAFEPVAERAGSRVGPYLLREQIGEGGFGLVFVAEQQEPVKRKVALKIIKPGMDSRQVIARFEAERQALALMDHPNIARVLDAGSTDSGRPYFVMELVRGIPINDYCDQNHLTPKERLELFVSVCHAIQHAHQKGIIHRDIKPSNVLVTSHDGKPVAKVIDFGVAKAIHQQLTDRTIYTNFAQMIGTPLYMSPEQAEMSGLDIDTRSDIYSLGVLLYELLTGSTPLEKKRFAKAAYDEIRRLIREEEPQRPSQRLSTSETLPSLAASRKTEPAKLSRMLKGELDWVVMKALEKDRTRRYETANGLARDIQRYLADEVVEARPPTTGYRLRKFARKNRAALTTAAAIVLLLIAGVAITGWQAWRARRAEAEAKASAKAQRQAKADADQQKESALRSAASESEARRKADVAKTEAQAKEAEANAIIEFFEDKVFSAGRPKGEDGGLGHDVSLRDAIKASLPALGTSFTAQPLVEARLRMTVGQTFFLLGDHIQAADQFAMARSLCARHRGVDHPDTLKCQSNLASSLAALNRFAEALKLREETLAGLRRVLPPDHPDILSAMNNLALGYAGLNRHTEAVKLFEEALASFRRVLPPDHPHTLQCMNNLALSYAALNRRADALKLREETLTAFRRIYPPGHPLVLMSMDNLALSYANLNRHAEAVKLFEEALPGFRKVLPPDHPDTLTCMLSLAFSYLGLNRPAEALPLADAFLAKVDRSGIDSREITRAIGLRFLCSLRLGDAVGCRATVEMMERRGPANAAGYYRFACYRAVTARLQAGAMEPDAARLAKNDADKAMDWLTRAIAAGFGDAQRLKRESDLVFLRDREDFKKLLADLESKSAAPAGEKK